MRVAKKATPKQVEKPAEKPVETSKVVDHTQDAYKSMLVIANDLNHDLRLYYDINDFSDDSCIGFVNMVISLSDGRFTSELMDMLKKVQKDGRDAEKTFVTKVLIMLNRKTVAVEEEPYIRPLGRHGKE